MTIRRLTGNIVYFPYERPTDEKIYIFGNVSGGTPRTLIGSMTKDFHTNIGNEIRIRQ